MILPPPPFHDPCALGRSVPVPHRIAIRTCQRGEVVGRHRCARSVRCIKQEHSRQRPYERYWPGSGSDTTTRRNADVRTTDRRGYRAGRHAHSPSRQSRMTMALARCWAATRCARRLHPRTARSSSCGPRRAPRRLYGRTSRPQATTRRRRKPSFARMTPEQRGQSIAKLAKGKKRNRSVERNTPSPMNAHSHSDSAPCDWTRSGSTPAPREDTQNELQEGSRRAP